MTEVQMTNVLTAKALMKNVQLKKLKKALNKPKNVTILRTKAITSAVTGQIYIRTCFINACLDNQSGEAVAQT